MIKSSNAQLWLHRNYELCSVVLTTVKIPQPVCKLDIHALSQYPPQIATDVEFDLRGSSGITEVVDEMRFVAVFGSLAHQLAMIVKVAKVIGGFVLIFPQHDVADLI